MEMQSENSSNTLHPLGVIFTENLQSSLPMVLQQALNQYFQKTPSNILVRFRTSLVGNFTGLGHNVDEILVTSDLYHFFIKYYWVNLVLLLKR